MNSFQSDSEPKEEPKSPKVIKTFNSVKEKNSNIWQLIFSKNTFICSILGFSSGLPLFILVSLLPIWLKTQGIDLKIIGIFSLLMFPYSWKFVWAPFLDAYFFRKIGRRRTWMFCTQLLLLLFIGLIAYTDPKTDMVFVTILGVLVSFFSASQDIVIDAFRREILSDQELGFGNSVHVNFYRLSALIPGSLALILSDHISWTHVFLIMALFMLPGLLLTAFVKEPKIYHQVNSLKEAIVEPFVEFFERRKLSGMLMFLLFLVLYKIGDSMATALITPFYKDLGFTNTEIGVTAKVIGTTSTVIGALLGGVIMMKIGINRSLWYFGWVQLVTILGFALLAKVGHDLSVLSLAVAGEYLGVGLGTASFTAFIARETNPAFTATQFALFTSIAAIPRVFCNSMTGYMVEHMGWFNFFVVCTLIAVPGLLLVRIVAPIERKI